MSSKKNSQIYVARFSRSTNEEDLNDHFKGFGKIKEISMKNGYAFIEYDDYRDAEEAVEKMDGKSIDGQKIVVEIAGANRKNRKNNTRGNDRGSGGARGPQPGDKCFNCGKTGHWANECRESKARRSDSYSSKSSSSSRDRKKKKSKKPKKNRSRSRSYSSKSRDASRDKKKRERDESSGNHKEKNNDQAKEHVSVEKNDKKESE